MNVIGLAYDANCNVNQVEYLLMAGPSVSTAQRLAQAIVVSVAPKSVGSSFRVKDDWKAPRDIKRDTILRESFTLAQISGYSILLDRAVKLLEKSAEAYIRTQPGKNILVKSKLLDRAVQMFERGVEKVVRKNPKELMKVGLEKFKGNQPLFLIALSCASNFMAETFSRKLAPRDIWEEKKGEEIKDSKSKDRDDDDDDDDKHTHQSRERSFKPQPIRSHPPVFSHQPDYRKAAYAMNPFTNAAFSTVMR